MLASACVGRWSNSSSIGKALTYLLDKEFNLLALQSEVSRKVVKAGAKRLVKVK